MKIIYTSLIYLYLFAIRVASLFNPKAKLWIEGRKNIFKKLQTQLSTLNSQHQTPDSKLIWFHCASLGEFEQGRPLMEKIKKKQPETKILLTFFSPSGYEIRKSYVGADYIFYLPMDTPSSAKKFIEIVKPEIAIFVKYEFWFNYLNELKKQHVPTYLTCGIFREDHYFFKNYSAWFRKQLNVFTHFYLQDESSLNSLNSIGYHNTTVTGDTRFDRVFEISKNVKQIDIVRQFVTDKKVFIAGSTWGEDLKIISDFNFKVGDYKLIIAPHEIDETNIQSTIQQFNSSTIVRYSQANEQNIKTADVLIIDNIGMLSSLYQYGTIAFIGGGFGKNIHNILEPATFGLPIIFGPKYHNFIEAKELIQLGGAFSISSSEEFKKTVDLLSKPEALTKAASASKNYVLSNIGATDKILRSIFKDHTL
ncbi:MAG: glycosyltransferase N-terminal domain-containing protein [Bacteroidota bacterium]|nr:glycosyltransferase N-terminal domain-containing protein [Bacteroidota bacterium]MDP1744782.1 glycosyltransferase N-terminal domain-containing protein [Bacteroidota bacterium]